MNIQRRTNAIAQLERRGGNRHARANAARILEAEFGFSRTSTRRHAAVGSARFA